MQQHRSTFSSRVSNLILDGYLQRHSVGPAVAMPPKLSLREREVVQLVGEGKTSKEVAMMLGVTVKTAETHRGNIMLKLKLHSIAELVLYAVRNEIVHVQLPAVVLRGPLVPYPKMAERTLPFRDPTEKLSFASIRAEDGKAR
jgi:DNA-binding CsgD family transcriptional regulator